MRSRWNIRISAALVLALLVAALTSAGCSRIFSKDALDGVVQPVIVPAKGVSGTTTVVREFSFEDAQVKLSIPVESAVYKGADSAEKTAIFLNGKEPADWVSGYYRAFINEKHQEAFYASLIDALHQVRDERGLDPARYAELVIALAQTMEYRVDPGDLAPKFAVETFVDGFGDCDDKTLLAAGILARDGYDVAVLVFSSEEHVALGLRASGLDYKESGYAYVEMTQQSIVGIPPDKLGTGTKLESKPSVIRIGDGDEEYTAGDQVIYIRRRLAAIEKERSSLAKRIAEDRAKLDDERADLESRKVQLESAATPPSQTEVDSYNERVHAYNDHVSRLDATISRHNALVSAQKYYAEHRSARPQVYAELKRLGS